jgi:gliding motility-associated-like protein
LNNGNFAIFGEFSNFDYTSHHVFKLILNKDLSIKESKAFSIPYGVGLGYAKISVFPNGETHFVSANYDRKKFYWWAADDQYNKLREKKIEYPDAYLHLQYMALQTGNNRSSYIVSSMLPGKSSIEMVQVENGDKGIMPCLGEDTSFVGYEYLQINTGSPPGWKSVKDNEAVLMPVSLSSIPVPVTTEYLCKPNPVPTQSDNNNFKISGIDTICVSDTTVIYTGKRINKSQPVYWELSSTYNQNFQILNDSTVSIKFVKADSIRQVKLYGYTGSCQVLKDSVLITVFPENNKFHGTVADCDFNFQLHPGKWFKSYLWQDGATDSVYNVTKAGVYTVKLQTYCGNFIKDSIVLMTPAFLLTPGSLSICKGDSGTIQVPEGFKDYMWSPSSNLVKITENTFRIFPEKDTFYVVTAAAIDGCEVQDTVYARVNRAATLDLGKDTIVCSEQAITLYAGSGFISYKWNTGNVTQNITIKASNTPYIILAKDANGCLASDTIIVSKKECSNSIYFPTAFTPNNDGKNDIFKASITGVLEEYELIIYNRWGEVVFTTNNNLSGWPGIFKGKEQKTDTYVRLCRYKFINEPAKVDKGTVTLIR